MEPCHQLIKHNAQRVNVRGRQNRLALELLGRHISRCAHDGPRDGSCARPRLDGRIGSRTGRTEVACQAKIHQDGAERFAFATEHDVGALQVAENDSVRMDEAETFTDIESNDECLLQRQRAIPLEFFSKRYAVKILHCQKGGGLLHTARRQQVKLMNPADLLASDLSGRLHLLAESLKGS